MTAQLGYLTIAMPDTARGRAFFGDVFDWEFDPAPDLARYSHIGNTAMPMGLKRDPSERGAFLYFVVADIQDAVRRVRALGGTANDPTQSDSGWSSACRDDQGGAFGLWQPAAGL